MKEEGDEPLFGLSTNNIEFAQEVKLPPKGTLISSSFNLSNAAIGAGVLAFPYAFSKCGLMLGIVIAIVQTIISGMSLNWVARESARKDHTLYASSYDQLVTNKLGNILGALCIFSLITNIFGAMIAFLIIIGDMVEPLAETIFGGSYWYSSRAFVSLVLVIVLVFPLSALPRIDSLAFTSTISILSISFVVFLVVYQSISANITGVAETGDVNAFIWGVGIFEAIPIITFALTCHVQVPPIYQEMKNHSTEKFKKVIIITYSTCFLLYVSCGSFGYWEYRAFTEDNILKNFPPDELAANLARICVIITALFSYPVMSFVFRQTIDYVFFNYGYELILRKKSPIVHPRYWRLFVESTLSLAIAWIISILVPSIGTVFGLIGASGGAMIVFVFPPLLEYSEAKTKLMKGLLVFIIVFGVIMGIISTTVIIVNDILVLF